MFGMGIEAAWMAVTICVALNGQEAITQESMIKKTAHKNAICYIAHHGARARQHMEKCIFRDLNTFSISMKYA